MNRHIICFPGSISNIMLRRLPHTIGQWLVEAAKMPTSHGLVFAADSLQGVVHPLFKVPPCFGLAVWYHITLSVKIKA